MKDNDLAASCSSHERLVPRRRCRLKRNLSAGRTSLERLAPRRLSLETQPSGASPITTTTNHPTDDVLCRPLPSFVVLVVRCSPLSSFVVLPSCDDRKLRRTTLLCDRTTDQLLDCLCRSTMVDSEAGNLLNNGSDSVLVQVE